MRERFRYPYGDGTELVIHELPRPSGSIWALIEDGRQVGRPETAILCQNDVAGDVIIECARRLTEGQGGQTETWVAVVRESLEPSF